MTHITDTRCQAMAASALLVALAHLPSCASRDEVPPVDAMYDSVGRMAWDTGYDSGAWEPDWDDAPFYGLAYSSQLGYETGDEAHIQRASEALEHDLAIVEAGLDGPVDGFLANMTEILYATLGILDYMQASGDLSPLPVVDGAIDLADDLASLLASDYLDGFSSYAADTYGPTVVTAMLAIVNLQYAVLLDADLEDARIARARDMMTRIGEVAWNGSFYQFDPETVDDLYLYPNIVMIIAHVRMYQATGDDAELSRAEALAAALDPLRYEDRPGFYSPYSAEVMGATTRDYTTLSSMNYALFAFGLLAQATGDESYRAEIDDVLRFVEAYLYVPADGKVYHHWMDGRLAVPTDPEYFCIGCNLQLLYVIWWVRHNLA